MSNIPNYVRYIIERVARIFDFSAEASQEINAFFDRPGEVGSQVSGLALEQARALSYLHAAEYSLLPAFSDPGILTFPPPQPITVSISDARMAMLKGNCTLIIWEHALTRDQIDPLSPSDLTVFSGDASKMNRVLPEKLTNEAFDHDLLRDYTDVFRSIHIESGWEPATRVAGSGVLSIQSLLWQMKLAVVANSTDEEFRGSLADIGASPIAQQMQIMYIDDIDGSEAADTVRFSYAGTDYEIDLSQKNADMLAEVLGPYIAAARRMGSPRRRPTRGSHATRHDQAAVRNWARSRGLKVSDRGRIPAAVLSGFEAAQEVPGGGCPALQE